MTEILIVYTLLAIRLVHVKKIIILKKTITTKTKNNNIWTNKYASIVVISS